MRAVICTKYGPPEVLQLREIEKPHPKDQEVLIKIHATTVTAADYRVRSFDIPASFWLPARLLLGLRRPRKPILGMELAGEIEAVGKAVSRFKKGDQVFAATLQTFGAYAQYICLAEDATIALKPEKITYEVAAAIPIGARTAYHYLKEIGDLKPQQKILIYGASGSVGTYAVQLAKYFGAEVTAVCSTANTAMVKALGADIVLDYTKADFTEKLSSYDLIFITIDKCSFSVCKKVLKKNGMYLNIGRPMPSLAMIWTALSTKRKVVVGKNTPESADVLSTLAALIEANQLKVVIDRKYPLDQIVDAHRYVDRGHKVGNVLITVNQVSENE